MAEYYIKQGDDSPVVATTLLDGNGNPASILDAEIMFVLQPVNEATILKAEAVNDQVSDGSDGTRGKCHFEWDAPITYPAGQYLAEWEVTYENSNVQTFPNLGFDSISVQSELGEEEAVSGGIPNFITVDELGSFLGRDLSNSALAAIAVDAGCQAVRDFLDQRIDYVEDETIVLFGNDRRLLLLPEMPIVEVTEVVIGEGNPFDSASYQIEGRGGLRRLDGNCWDLHTQYTITYSHGWSVKSSETDIVSVPSTIRTKALEIAAEVMVAGKVGVGGIRSETVGTYSYRTGTEITRGAQLSEDQGASIARYRQEDVA